MNMSDRPSFRFICRLLVISMIALCMPMRMSQAAMVGSEAVIDQSAASDARAQVRAFLDRADVRAQLQARGVDPESARQRVDGLTDDEVRRVAGHIDSLPAGGTDFLAVLLVIFIVLLITDILGFTKIFPFTRAIN